MAKARSRPMRLTWRAGSCPVRSLGPFLPDRACLRPATLALPCQAFSSGSIHTRTSAAQDRGSAAARPPSKKPEWGQPGPLPGLGKAAAPGFRDKPGDIFRTSDGLSTAEAVPRHLSPAERQRQPCPTHMVAGKASALSRNGKFRLSTAATWPYYYDYVFIKTYKEEQGTTWDGLPRNRAQRIEGPSMPRRGPEGLPHAVHAQEWAWKGCRRAFRREAVGGLPHRLVAGLCGLWGGIWGMEGMSVPGAPEMRARLPRVSAGKASGPGSLPGRFQAAAG